MLHGWNVRCSIAKKLDINAFYGRIMGLSVNIWLPRESLGLSSKLEFEVKMIMNTLD